MMHILYLRNLLNYCILLTFVYDLIEIDIEFLSNLDYSYIFQDDI